MSKVSEVKEGKDRVHDSVNHPTIRGMFIEHGRTAYDPAW